MTVWRGLRSILLTYGLWTVSVSLPMVVFGTPSEHRLCVSLADAVAVGWALTLLSLPALLGLELCIIASEQRHWGGSSRELIPAGVLVGGAYAGALALWAAPSVCCAGPMLVHIFLPGLGIGACWGILAESVIVDPTYRPGPGHGLPDGHRSARTGRLSLPTGAAGGLVSPTSRF